MKYFGLVTAILPILYLLQKQQQYLLHRRRCLSEPHVAHDTVR